MADAMFIRDMFYGMLFGIFITFCLIFILIKSTTPIQLTQETGNELCRNLTSNNNSIAQTMFGKFQCNIPIQNDTIESNIIIKEIEK